MCFLFLRLGVRGIYASMYLCTFNDDVFSFSFHLGIVYPLHGCILPLDVATVTQRAKACTWKQQHETKNVEIRSDYGIISSRCSYTMGILDTCMAQVVTIWCFTNVGSTSRQMSGVRCKPSTGGAESRCSLNCHVKADFIKTHLMMPNLNGLFRLKTKLIH